jgi:NADH-quinone oxidoreductase subunit K
METIRAVDITTLSLLLAAILFAIGVAGVVFRRNAIILFLCVELMLNAVNLAFVAFSRSVGVDGQIFVFFVMTVAAAEAAVGLALVIAVFRHFETVDIGSFRLLRW